MIRIRRRNNIVNGYLGMAYFIDDMLFGEILFFLISESTKTLQNLALLQRPLCSSGLELFYTER